MLEQKSKTVETFFVKTRRVFCCGGSRRLAHPGVYLLMEPTENEIICPYCSCRFVLEEKKEYSLNSPSKFIGFSHLSLDKQ